MLEEVKKGAKKQCGKIREGKMYLQNKSKKGKIFVYVWTANLANVAQWLWNPILKMESFHNDQKKK